MTTPVSPAPRGQGPVLSTRASGLPALELLGGAVLRIEGKPAVGPASRRHPMALLSLLATAPSLALGRGKIVALLWPEADEAAGRNRLTTALYNLRRVLGRSTLVSVGDAVRLDGDRVSCDVWELRSAVRSGDWAAAVRVYAGPLLDGFHLDGSRAFEERIAREREQLRRDFASALESLAEAAEASGDAGEAAHWWRRRAEEDPYDSRVAVRLVRLLDSAGEPVEALRTADAWAARLRTDLGAAPPPELAALIEGLRSATAATDRREPSIAVLPFEVPDPEERSPVAEGMHAAVLGRLSEVPSLRVIARTTTLQYRGTGAPASRVGRELGVEWVLEGTVRETARELRLEVRLVKVATDDPVWVRGYRTDLTATGLFALQADTARDIAQRLRVEPGSGARARGDGRPTQDLEAYRLWAEGRMRLEHRGEEEMQRAVLCFEEAARLDPAYADAWVGLADALGLLHAYGFRTADQVLGPIEDALDRALRLEPDSADARAALGRLLGQKNRGPDAQRQLERAVALKPGYAEAHNWLAVGYHIAGEPEKALASSRRAVELNPLSPEAIYNFALSLLITGRHERALAEARRSLRLVPEYDSGRFLEGLILFVMGRYDEAAARLDGLAVPWAAAGARAFRALALAAAGEERRARALLEAMDPAEHALEVALVRAGLGEIDAAAEALREATIGGLEHSKSYWPTIAVRYLCPDVWDRVRPAYDELLRRIDAAWQLQGRPRDSD